MTADALAARALPWKVMAAAALFALLLSCLGAGSFPLLDVDEPRFAQASRTMLETGDFLVPRFNGAVRYDKPPLIYWLQAPSFALLDIDARAARLPSALAIALAAALTALLAFWRTQHASTALLAGAILATAPQVQIMGHAATADALLLACTTLSIAGMVLREEGPPRALTWWMMWGGLGLALLAKGPAALVAPLAVALALRRRATWRLWPLGMLLALALPLGWFIPANAATHNGFVSEGLGHHVLARSTRPFEGHGGLAPWWLLFYPLALLVFFIPWSAFLPSAALAFWRRRTAEPAWHRIASCWAGGMLLAFTLVASKLPHYVLPLYPLLAIETARFLARPDAAPAKGPALALLAVGMLGAGAPLLYALEQDLPEIVWPALALAVIFLLAGLGGFLLLRRGALRATATYLILAMTLVTGTLTLDAIGKLAPSLLTRALTSELEPLLQPDTELYSYGLDLPSLVFRLDRTIGAPSRSVGSLPAQAVDFLERHHGYLLVRLRDDRDVLQALASVARERGNVRLVESIVQPDIVVRGYLPSKGQWFDVAVVAGS